MKSEARIALPVMITFILMLTHHVKVVVKSSAASDNYGSCGTSFFVGSPRVSDSILTHLRLMVSSCEYVQVTFSVRTAAGIVYSGTALPTRVAFVDLPIHLTVRNSTYSNRHKGIHVSSLNGYPMSVMVIAQIVLHLGEYLAHHCPPPAWQEYEYFAISTGSQSGQKHWGLVLLVACHNDTIITITPTQDVSLPVNAQDPSSLNVTVSSGDSHTVTLHELQTLLVGKPESDITGTRILSNKPLSVVSGNECGTVPTHLLLCEPLQMQVPPTATWGKRFLVPPVPWRMAGYMIKVVAAQNNTNLTHTCASNSSNIMLSNAGESYSYMAPQHTFCSVVSTHPLLVAQLGLGYLAGFYGDPSIAIVPPIEHYTKLRVPVITLNFTHYPLNFVTFFVPAEHFSSSLLFIEHAALPDIDTAWTPIADHNNTVLGYGRSLYLPTQGIHVLHHLNYFATVCATVNGFAHYTAYAYTAAVDIKPLNPVTLLNQSSEELPATVAPSAVIPTLSALQYSTVVASGDSVNNESSGTAFDLISTLPAMSLLTSSVTSEMTAEMATSSHLVMGTPTPSLPAVITHSDAVKLPTIIGATIGSLGGVIVVISLVVLAVYLVYRCRQQ